MIDWYMPVLTVCADGGDRLVHACFVCLCRGK